MPAATNWMGDWSSYVGNTQRFLKEVASNIPLCRMFADAANERWAAIGQAEDLQGVFAPAIAYPESGSGQSIKAFWSGLWQSAFALQQTGRWVRTYNTGGNTYNPNGRFEFASLLKEKNYNAATIPQPTEQPYDNFVPGVGSGYIYDSFDQRWPHYDFNRNYPRRIFPQALSSPAQGNRARMIGLQPQDYAISGKYYDKVNGQWALSPDQLSDEDQLSRSAFRDPVPPFNIVPLLPTYPEGGDWFDGRHLNIVRDALNTMTRTFATSTGAGGNVTPTTTLRCYVPEVPPFPQYSAPGGVPYNEWQFGTYWTRSGFGFSYDACFVYDYNEARGQFAETGGWQKGPRLQMGANVGGFEGGVGAECPQNGNPDDPVYFLVFGPRWNIFKNACGWGNINKFPNPLNRTRKISFYVLMNVFNQGTSLNQHFNYDTFGDHNHPRARWSKLWETVTANSAPREVVTPIFGNLNDPPPPIANHPYECGSHDYLIAGIAAIVDWAEEGGFQHCNPDARGGL